ncbi:hypothetical protein EU524_01135 [Candidatus Thorarchaeota archaeon]|nr:MAG: hypothetical protein EU524_01135 [Candidatus Thorarchaeota archaeon]
MADTSSSASDIRKYLRVFPILGLLFYYIGGLIASLGAADLVLFLVQVILLSAVLLLGLGLMRKEIVIAGALILVLFSIGLPAYLLVMGTLSLGAGTLGQGIMVFAVVFHMLTVWVWSKE